MAKLKFKKTVQRHQILDSPSNDVSEKDVEPSESTILGGTSIQDSRIEDQPNMSAGPSEQTTTGERNLNSGSSIGPVETFSSHHEAANHGCEKCGQKLHAICAIHAHRLWVNCCGNCQTKKFYRVSYDKTSK